jgi:predicted permease
MTKDPAVIVLADRWCRLLVRAYPARFREEMGEAMLEAYRDRARDAYRASGIIGIVTLCGRATVDTVRNGPGEHLRPAARWPRGGKWGARFAGVGGDLRHVPRAARTHPGLTATIVLTAALGIGATSAVFSLVNAVLMRPLPYPSPDRLLILMTTWRGRVPVPGLSAPEFFAWRRIADIVESSAAYRLGGTMMLDRDGLMVQIGTGRVSADFFRLFGAQPARGRTFTEEEDRPRGPAVVVLSHEFWQRHMGAASEVVGQGLVLNGQSYEVIGVLDRDFNPGPLAMARSPRPDLWLPLQLDSETISDAPLLAVARLRRDASIDIATAQTEAATAEIRRTLPELMPEPAGLAVAPLHAVIVRDVRAALLLLLVAVALVLLIVCVNITHLLLVRAIARQREMAIRLATGASRWQIVRQLLAESLVVSTIGAVLGVILAFIGLRALLVTFSDALPPIVAGSVTSLIDSNVIAFAASVTVITGVFFGLAPARQLWLADLEAVLRGSRGSTSGMVGRRLGGIFVVSEMALAVMLVIGAALLVRSFLALRSVDPGFDGRSVMTLDIPIAGYRAETTDAAWRTVNESLRRVAALPGVDGAAATLTSAPLSGATSFLNMTVPGRSLGGPYFNGGYLGGWQVVSPAYFDAYRIPIIAGRTFTDRDVASAAPVVVINQSMARQFWPDENPLGHHLRIGEGAGPEFEETTHRQVIGVVGDVRHVGLQWNARPAAYIPLAQLPQNQFSVLSRGGGSVTLAIRAVGDLDTLALSVQRDLQRASGIETVSNARSMLEVSRTSSIGSEFITTLMVGFGLAAVVLAAMGVFGVMGYGVRERTREIGIRVALGACERTILTMILVRGVRLSVVGIAVGTTAAYGLANTLQSVLYAVTARDYMVFLTIPFALMLVALFAVFLPARSAARLDPIAALKYE